MFVNSALGRACACELRPWKQTCMQPGRRQLTPSVGRRQRRPSHQPRGETLRWTQASLRIAALRCTARLTARIAWCDLMLMLRFMPVFWEVIGIVRAEVRCIIRAEVRCSMDRKVDSFQGMST